MNKTPLDDKLNQLIMKYAIDLCYPRFSKNQRAITLIRDLIKECDLHKELLLIGENATDIAYFVQDTAVDFAYQELLIDVEDLTIYDEYDFADFGQVLVLSFYAHSEITAKLYRKGIHALSLYDYFEKNNLYTEGCYYDIFQQKYREHSTGEWSSDYAYVDINRIFFYDRSNYEKALDREAKQFYLQKMIFDCVFVRDFISLQKYIEQYLGQRYKNWNRYSLFWHEVEAVLKGMRDSLRKRKQRDVLLFWIDSFEYGEEQCMPYLSSLTKEQGLEFTRAFTVTPYTHSTAKAMLCKARVVEDKAYEIKNISKENSPVIREFDERGWEFHFYGKLPDFSQSVTSGITFNCYSCCSWVYWTAMQDLITSEKPLFAILHNGWTTHAPFLTFGIEEEEYTNKLLFPGTGQREVEIEEKQRIPSRMYVDQQLQYYSEILADTAYKIYMSDHGHTLHGRFHTILKIVQKDIKKQIINQVFSYYNFDELLYWLLGWSQQKLEDCLSEYAMVQDVDFYSPVIIKKVLQCKEKDLRRYVGYQGIVTAQDIFIRYNDGWEEYYKHENDRRLFVPERIAYLQSLVRPYRINRKKEKKFLYSDCIYQVMERYRRRGGDREGKKYAALCQMIDEIKESEVIGIRGGGEHTFRLWLLLTWKQRQRIRYIVDEEQQCIAGKFGIPVVDLNQMKETEITTIIISSFRYRTRWYQEIKQSNPAISVIELYSYLENHGMKCEQEFYLKDYIEEDFDVDLPEIGE